MYDDRVLLVALDHADVEETGIFALHGVMHEAAVAVAMVLRSLDQADFGSLKTGTRLVSQSDVTI
jgi:hypothetical protein